MRFGTSAEQRAHGGFVGSYAEGDSGLRSESWLGVPIMAGREAIGVVVLGDAEPNKYTDADERLVSTVASSMGVALENARLFDETKHLLGETEQRNAELAVINEIGAALAKQLEFQAIIDAVGDKLGEVLHSQDLFIAIYDKPSGEITFPYWIENGVRDLETPTLQLGEGLSSRIISSGKPLRVGSMAEADKLGAVQRGDAQQSFLGVPIPGGDGVIGVLSLSRVQNDAFSEADEQLVSTVASSMGVALANARLFDETKRLLAETNERAAELVIVNSVQEGLAAKLDMQSMYELVGDKIEEIFDAQVVTVAVYDSEATSVRLPYVIERGVREAPVEPHEIDVLDREMIEKRTPLLVNDLDAWYIERGVKRPVFSGDPAKSIVLAPLMRGSEVRGHISIQNVDRVNAYSDSDLRLLATLAGSLSVALENARLFDETQRLLTETNDRAAELAIINSVQQGLAEKLDMQSMYDLVGDKLQEIFDAQVVDIGMYDRIADEVTFTYGLERGVRLEPLTIPLMGPRRRVVETRAPLLINDNSLERLLELGQSGAIVGELAIRPCGRRSSPETRCEGSSPSRISIARTRSPSLTFTF